MSTFSVILLAYNNLEETTKPCLESLFQATVKTDFQIVVVDNASEDGTADYLKSIESKHDNLKIVLNATNKGYSGGNNTGVEAYKADYYILLNSDTIVTDGWLDKFEAFFKSHPDTGLIGPMTNSAGNEQTLCLNIEEEQGEDETTSRNERMQESIRQGLQWCARHEGSHFFTDCLGFFCVAIRQEVFDTIGLLDESYGIGMFEDEDFCKRAEQAGFEMACMEDVFIYHMGSYSFKKLGEKLHMLFLSNLEKFKKNYGIEWESRLSPKRIAKLLLADMEKKGDGTKLNARIVNRLRLLERCEDKSLENYRLWREMISKDKLIDRLQNENASKHREVLELMDKVKELESWTENLSVGYNNATTTISDLHNSLVWRLMVKYYEISSKTPVLREIQKTLNYLKRNGFRQTYFKIYYKFFAPLHQVWKKNKKYFPQFQTNKEDKTPKVSVILPVYNQADLIEESIESVLAQSYKNFELIIVNDGSKDGIETIFDKYLDDPRIILLNQQNLKLPAALNNAFDYATGTFFTWTSADNVMLPDQLTVLVKELRNDPRAGLVFSDYIAIDDTGNPLKDPNFRPQNQDPSDMSIMRLPHEVTEANFHDSGDNFLGASFMYRKEVADIVGKYFTHTFGGEDYDYWLRIHNLFKLRHVPNILYKYRVHENTLNAKAAELRLFDNIQALLSNDRDRRKFLNQPLAVKQIGTQITFPKAGQNQNKAVLFTQEYAANALSGLDETTLSVCLLETRLADVSSSLLNAVDVVVPLPGDGPYYLNDVRYKTVDHDFINSPELFVQILKSKLFDKLKITAPSLPKARPYSPRKLRVGVLADSMDKGGLEKVLYNLVLALPEDRYEMHVYIAGNDMGYLGTSLAENFPHVHVLKNDKKIFAKFLDEHKIDLMNLHYSLFGLDVIKAKGIGTVYTVHNSYVWLQEGEALLRHKAYNQIDSFICVSSQVASYFSQRFEIPPSKMRVIPNGFDVADFVDKAPMTRAELGIAEDDYVFLNIASINGIKLQSLTVKALTHALKKNPKIKVIFLGNVLDSYYSNFVNCFAQREGVFQNIVFIDYSPKDEVAALLDLSDAFVLPSIIEGWSNAVMEAMYAEKPLVLSDVGSARDVIEDEDIGLVIPNAGGDTREIGPDDVFRISRNTDFPTEHDLADAMLKMVENRDEWREKGKLGKKKLLEKYTVDVMASAYADFYEDAYYVLRKKNRG